MHHPDTGVDRARRRGKPDLLSVQKNAARVRLDKSKRDSHQRRLAGAILAKQGMDAPRAHRQTCAVERARRAKVLDDVLDLKGQSSV